MQRTLKFCFGTTIGIFSGGPRFDKTAANVMSYLRKHSNNSVSFVGVIGDEYKSQFDHVYSSTSVLDHEQIVINRHYKEVVQQAPIVPYRTLTHWKNYQLLQNLRQQKIYDDLSSRRVDALVSIGNYSLIKRLYTGLNQFYKKSNRVKPATFAFDALNAYRVVENQEFLDFLFYNLPKNPDNLQKYVFPSMCVGYDGLYKAFRHLNNYNKNENGSFRSKNFSHDVHQMVQASRHQFRSKRGINQDNYLTFFAPGNLSKQIKFSFKTFTQALKRFKAEQAISGVSSDFFQVLIPLPSDPSIAQLIKSQASLISSFKVTLIEQADIYAAMCSSDFSVLHNGEIVVEAAACQLPATVISSMSNYKAYLTYLFNGHESPLNVATNYQGYQDLLGSSAAIPEKIKDIMLDHFQRPKLRFYYAKLYRQTIQKMLLRDGQNPSMLVEKTGFEVAAQQILESAKVYRNSDVNVRISRQRRRELLGV